MYCWEEVEFSGRFAVSFATALLARLLSGCWIALLDSAGCCGLLVCEYYWNSLDFCWIVVFCGLVFCLSCVAFPLKLSLIAIINCFLSKIISLINCLFKEN